MSNQEDNTVYREKYLVNKYFYEVGFYEGKINHVTDFDSIYRTKENLGYSQGFVLDTSYGLVSLVLGIGVFIKNNEAKSYKVNGRLNKPIEQKPIEFLYNIETNEIVCYNQT